MITGWAPRLYTYTLSLESTLTAVASMKLQPSGRVPHPGTTAYAGRCTATVMIVPPMLLQCVLHQLPGVLPFALVVRGGPLPDALHELLGLGSVPDLLLLDPPVRAGLALEEERAELPCRHGDLVVFLDMPEHLDGRPRQPLLVVLEREHRPPLLAHVEGEVERPEGRRRLAEDPPIGRD